MRCEVCGKQSLSKYCMLHDKNQSRLDTEDVPNIFSHIQSRLLEIEREVLNNKEIQAINRDSKVVFGYGTGVNKIVIIGTAPSMRGGAIAGIPFSSPVSGKLVNDILLANNVKKEECFISNVCFTGLTDNRSPNEYEIGLCLPYLVEVIKLIKPRIIILLGNVAKNAFIEEYSIDYSNEFFQTKIAYNYAFNFVSLPHPSFIIRLNNEKILLDYKDKFKSVLNAFKDITVKI